MKNTTFILCLAGLILGLIWSMIWIFMGTDFWADFLSAAAGVDGFGIPDEYYGYGFFVTLIQTVIPIVAFVISLIMSLPKNLAVNPRKNGLWIMWIGIGTFVVNISFILPCILLVIAGAVTLGEKSNIEKGI